MKDRFAWKITDVYPKVRVIEDCDLSKDNIIILDRDWYTTGYFIAVKNFDGSKCRLQIIGKIEDKEGHYKILDVDNTRLIIKVGAEVIADYINLGTESINK